MTANSSFDRDLELWLETEAPARGPAGLHETAMNRARTTRQRAGWLVAARGGTFGMPAVAIGRPAVRFTYVLVILGLILAALFVAVAGGAFRSDPAVLVAPTPAAPTPAASAETLEDVYTSVLRSGVAFTSRSFEPHISFKLATRSGLFDTIGLDPDWCPSSATAGPGSIVLFHPKGCRDRLMILRPYAIDCGTADAHPDAATLAAALLANPGLATARDLGTLQTPGAVPPRLFLGTYQGRVIAIDPSPGPSLAATDPNHCRLLPEPGSSDPTIEVRGDTPALLVLVDVRGQLVVLLDASSLQAAANTQMHLLEHIYDITFD